MANRAVSIEETLTALLSIIMFGCTAVAILIFIAAIQKDSRKPGLGSSTDYCATTRTFETRDFRITPHVYSSDVIVATAMWPGDIHLTKAQRFPAEIDPERLSRGLEFEDLGAGPYSTTIRQLILTPNVWSATVHQGPIGDAQLTHITLPALPLVVAESSRSPSPMDVLVQSEGQTVIGEWFGGAGRMAIYDSTPRQPGGTRYDTEKSIGVCWDGSGMSGVLGPAGIASHPRRCLLLYISETTGYLVTLIGWTSAGRLALMNAKIGMNSLIPVSEPVETLVSGVPILHAESDFAGFSTANSSTSKKILGLWAFDSNSNLCLLHTGDNTRPTDGSFTLVPFLLPTPLSTETVASIELLSIRAPFVTLPGPGKLPANIGLWILSKTTRLLYIGSIENFASGSSYPAPQRVVKILADVIHATPIHTQTWGLNPNAQAPWILTVHGTGAVCVSTFQRGSAISFALDDTSWTGFRPVSAIGLGLPLNNMTNPTFVLLVGMEEISGGTFRLIKLSYAAGTAVSLDLGEVGQSVAGVSITTGVVTGALWQNSPASDPHHTLVTTTASGLWKPSTVCGAELGQYDATYVATLPKFVK
jgi:hypothetical protein